MEVKHGPAAASSSSSSSVTLEAPCVVVNGDLARVERQLLPPHLARDFTGWSYSCSVVTFHWALSTRLHALAHHSIFLGGLDEPLAEEREGGKSRRQAWDWEGLGKGPQPTGQQGQQDQQGQPVNFYVHAPSRSDPSQASRQRTQPGHATPPSHLRSRARAGRRPPHTRAMRCTQTATSSPRS